jgi:hypothetical protein
VLWATAVSHFDIVIISLSALLQSKGKREYKL